MTDGRVLPGPGTLYRTVAAGTRNRGAAAEWPAAGTAPGLSLCLAPDGQLGSRVTEKDIQLFPQYVLRAPLLRATAPHPRLPGRNDRVVLRCGALHRSAFVPFEALPESHAASVTCCQLTEVFPWLWHRGLGVLAFFLPF